jgi:hypothetical protein
VTPHGRDKRSKDVRGTCKAWLAAVVDMIAHARKFPRGGPDRATLLGVPRCIFLTVTAAAQPPWKVRCIVEVFSGLPPLATLQVEFRKGVGHGFAKPDGGLLADHPARPGSGRALPRQGPALRKIPGGR